MANIPTADKIRELNKSSEALAKTIIWMTGCLIKNLSVRTTSEEAANAFKARGFTVTKEDGTFTIQA